MTGLFEDDPPLPDPEPSGPGLFGDGPAPPVPAEPATTPYRVLARKYRPTHFGDLIGQEAMVRTLRNAFAMGRVAHAFMLTGVRGVGKTTTARIIARALNCTGPDGQGGPTADPCGVCPNCLAILADRHPDVQEMDAASRTGVEDVREIIEATRFRPMQARAKVFIIDEVHMLSRNAFNALLKTLEEPPPHVIFIFATTEIRKVPVTVLSRCQRFDLRRLDVPTLEAHYKWVCEQEGFSIEDEALALIARAADGSARDGMSILDQAIALSEGTVTAAQVKDMLGIADRNQVLDMLEHALKGECPQALEIAADLYRKGADPAQLLEDMLDFTHLMTRLRVAPKAGGLQALGAQDMIARAADLSARLSMPALGRAWQILLKGIGEIREAPAPHRAAEMILIRLAYAADLPDPADLLKKLKSGQGIASPSAPANVAVPTRQPEPAMRRVAGGGGPPMDMMEAPGMPDAYPSEQLRSLEDIVALLNASREVVLAGHIYHNVHLVKIETGRLEIRPEPQAPQDMAQNLRRFLIERTETQWFVSISGAPGEPTLAERQAQGDKMLLDEAGNHPFVREVLSVFPKSTLKIIKNQH